MDALVEAVFGEILEDTVGVLDSTPMKEHASTCAAPGLTWQGAGAEAAEVAGTVRHRSGTTHGAVAAAEAPPRLAAMQDLIMSTDSYPPAWPRGGGGAMVPAHLVEAEGALT